MENGNQTAAVQDGAGAPVARVQDSLIEPRTITLTDVELMNFDVLVALRQRRLGGSADRFRHPIEHEAIAAGILALMRAEGIGS